MWMINPSFLCRKHLLGEHGELHKHRHNFIKKHNMNKRVKLGQIDHTKLLERHEELVKEMKSRGYKHNSPYSFVNTNYIKEKPCIDVTANKVDLMNRCKDCRERIKKYE